MKPMSLMSKPGVLNDTFELKRRCSPPILLSPIEPPPPASDVRERSSVALLRACYELAARAIATKAWGNMRQANAR